MRKTENDVQDDLSNGISTQRIQNQYIWRRARMETELTFSIVLGKLAPSIFFFPELRCFKQSLLNLHPQGREGGLKREAEFGIKRVYWMLPDTSLANVL